MATFYGIFQKGQPLSLPQKIYGKFEVSYLMNYTYYLLRGYTNSIGNKNYELLGEIQYNEIYLIL